MQKIPTIYRRGADKKLTDEINPACQWVFDGEGTPTRKWDGTAMMLTTSGRWWARRTLKPSQKRPDEFLCVETDPATNIAVGWVPIESTPYAKPFRSIARKPTRPGTYELCGPKVNGNPEGFSDHVLMPHGMMPVHQGDMSPRELVAWVAQIGAEGIVWWHPDGRKAKLKVRDL